jgi:hypothetical protein
LLHEELSAYSETLKKKGYTLTWGRKGWASVCPSKVEETVAYNYDVTRIGATAEFAWRTRRWLTRS